MIAAPNASTATEDVWDSWAKCVLADLATKLNGQQEQPEGHPLEVARLGVVCHFQNHFSGLALSLALSEGKMVGMRGK